MTTHLIVPDAHAKPGISNRRFDWAGKLIAELQPDVVVQVGDFFDMPSLCSYDRGTKGFEGRRYKKDLDAGYDAIERIMAPAAKVRGYKPRWVALGGNHDDGRINKVSSSQPEFDGVVSVADLRWNDFGWDHIPYKDTVKIDGVNYSHCLPSGVMGRPIGGENPCTAILRQHHESSTVGHSHLYDYAERITVSGKRAQAMMVGCFFEHVEDYAGPLINKMWWRGLVFKEFLRDGTYDWTRFSMSRLKEIYN